MEVKTMQSNNKPVCNFCGEEIIKPKRAYRSSLNGCLICEECVKILYGKTYKNIENISANKKRQKNDTEGNEART